MTALQVQVRKVRKSDIERIVDIERSWFHLSHWSIDSYYRLLSDDGFTTSFVAESEDEENRLTISGFVIFHVAAGVSEIYNIAVDSSYARQGIGRRLLATAIEESKIRKATRVVLEVRKSNSGAIQFYDEFHFQVIGERKNYYSNPMEDAFVMEYQIPESNS
jgi:ribosomal-protein-alanine N-acetyltransferase